MNFKPIWTLFLIEILLLFGGWSLLPPTVQANRQPAGPFPSRTISFVSVMPEQHVQAEPNTVGDPVGYVTCPTGYTATVYAEGLLSPDGLALSPAGELYVAEEGAGQVSRVDPDGAVAPVLTGLNSPEGIAFDRAGHLYVVEDIEAGRLLRLAADGITTTLASGLDAPEGVTVAPDGTIYLTESTVEFAIHPSGFDTRVTAVSGPGATTTVGSNAPFLWSYAGLTLDPAGALYVTNEASGIGTQDGLFIIDPISGDRTLFAANLVRPEGLRFGPNGDFPLYVVEENSGDGSGKLSRVEANGAHLPFCTGFQSIEDVLVDEQGRLFVSEDGSGRIILIESDPPARTPAQAIILFIGDGMGEPQRTAARWSAAGQSGALAMDRLPAVGWSRTANVSGAVTDSAAGATAIATGVKTNNGIVGMDPDENPLTTILEQAQARGMAVGLVTTTQMAHATPAAFAAHVPDRDQMTDIAEQMLAHEVEVLLGGGEDEFLPLTVTGHYPQSGERTDGRNLIDEAIAAGYTYVYTATDLAAVDPGSTGRLLGLFADEGLTRPHSPSLAEMTGTAIDILSQDPDGFFLMVEGGQIDWAAHANDAANVITDTLSFDQAVTVAQSYALTATDTLIIVTADHETGGMSLNLTSGEEGPFTMPNGTPFYVNWSSIYHSGANVPVTAQGPWSELLNGTYENTYLYTVMSLALNPNLVALPIILQE